MLPPVVFEPLHREVTGVFGLGENFDVISSPNKDHEERAADLLIWAHAGGPALAGAVVLAEGELAAPEP